MAMTKRKTTTAIVAGVTAAALLLGGTFAWTSISQQAKNEAIVDINPGGRLHDDFNGTNKDVYVENFGDDLTGVPIYARIRLYEYMEIGQQAGNKTIADDERKADSLIDGDTISDTANWEIYKYNTESAFTKYWSWTLGNNDEGTLPYYMPTFNKNKDSLAADINGTYEGTVEGDIVHYDDYTQYGETSEKEGTEVYDWDEDTTEEDGVNTAWDNGGITTDDTTPIDSADVYHKSTVTNEETGEVTNLKHTAAQISTTSTVMSMEDWIAAGSQPGPYWVFDTDGWAYWAQPIQPGTTTGLLLDGIQMTRVPDDSWYYGINVVGQFATDSDWEMFFAPENEGGAGENEMTDNAKTLMGLITGTAADDNTGGETEDPSVEAPTYYTMNVDYPLESGTTVTLNADYTDETPDDSVSYYIINKENNPNGGSDTELAASGDLKVVPIAFESAGGALTETKYYYAEPFTNSSAVTTTEHVEGVTFVAMDGDNVVAFSCTKVYDATVHTYLGTGEHKYFIEENEQSEGCLVFKSVNTETYCTIGNANVGVDGDDKFMVADGVTDAAEGAAYDYNVTDITETACTCSASSAS